jgi:hypothetical protein
MKTPQPQTWAGMVYGGLFGVLFSLGMKIFNLLLFLICLSEWGLSLRRWVEEKIALYDVWEQEKKKKKEEEEEEKKEEKKKLKKLIVEALAEVLAEEKEKEKKLIAEGVEQGRMMERRRLRVMVENEFS